jgi:hypothetical protein
MVFSLEELTVKGKPTQAIAGQKEASRTGSLFSHQVSKLK